MSEKPTKIDKMDHDSSTSPPPEYGAYLNGLLSAHLKQVKKEVKEDLKKEFNDEFKREIEERLRREFHVYFQNNIHSRNGDYTDAVFFPVGSRSCASESNATSFFSFDASDPYDDDKEAEEGLREGLGSRKDDIEQQQIRFNQGILEPSAGFPEEFDSHLSVTPLSDTVSLRREVQLLRRQIEEMKEKPSNALTTLRGRRSLMPGRAHLYSSLVRPGLEPCGGAEEEEDDVDYLEPDTFSLMIVSKPFSPSWILGLFAFVLQITLGVYILLEQIQQLKIPFYANSAVRVGQLFTIILCLATQNDILTSIRSFLRLGSESNWNEVIGESGNRSKSLWIIRIMIPTLMKLTQGIIVVVVSFLIIVQSQDIIDLLKDFTSLMVLSDTDNVLFNLADYGYLGKQMQSEAAALSEIKIRKIRKDTGSVINPSETSLFDGKRSFNIRSFSFFLLSAPLFTSWVYFVTKQIDGTYFKKEYKNCDFALAKVHFNDGNCYGGPLNTLNCEFEGGDCTVFNIAYPNCRGDKLIFAEENVGNGICDADFNIAECQFDGGDCCTSEYTNSSLFGNGECNGGRLATKECFMDKGDCKNFHQAYSDCPHESLSQKEGSDSVIIGDGICDGPIYDIKDCGYEFGDCEVSQVGQDLIFGAMYSDELQLDTHNVFMLNMAMNMDGSKMVVGLPYSNTTDGELDQSTAGFAKVYTFHSDRKVWIAMGGDILGTEIKDLHGWSVAMSSNGYRVAIGDIGNDSNGRFTGHVRVFDFSDTTDSWLQVGETIYGEKMFSFAGYNVHLSADGSRLAIASSSQDNFTGVVKVFDFDSSEERWNGVGRSIYGKGEYEYLGYEFLRINSLDGSRLITSVGGERKNLLRAYVYDDITQDWMQLGQEITSPYLAQGSAEISADGNRIAVSSNSTNPAIPGNVRVFDFNPSFNKWDQVGVPISLSSRDNRDGFGRSLAMSSDGNRLAISSINPQCDGRPSICATGSVHIYTYDSKERKFMKSVVSKEPSPNVNDGVIQARMPDNHVFGIGLSLNEDGSWLTITAYNMVGDYGVVSVYDLNELFYLKCNVPIPDEIRNGHCNSFDPYISEECGFDGGDCPIPSPKEGMPDCKVVHPEWIKDGTCNEVPPYNSKKCNFDGGDCNFLPVEGYPECTVHNPKWIGNGICTERPPYNTEQCGYDGGDCATGARNDV